MQRMQRQARQTDDAIRRLGMTTDAVGSPQQQKQLTDTERNLAHLRGEVQRTSPAVRTLTRDVDRHASAWQRVRDKIINLGAVLRGAQIAFKALLIPALGAGIGILVQAIGALAGGIIALTPRVADLAGTLAALPATIVGVGLAVGTVKLAFKDFSEALGGNKKALERLTPEARRFMQTIQQYRPVLDQLRASAQGGLFAGLDYALRRVQRGVPIVNQLLQGMSRTLGNLAAQAATRFTTSGFLADFLGIGRAGTRTVQRGGAALLNIVDALRHLTAAAIPFTDWLGKMVLRASRFVDRWALFQRDSGRFAAFLGRTQRSLALFGHIIENLWHWFTALSRAARPLGDMLWRDAERGTRSWARYANSIEGQVSMMRQFVGMHDSIKAIVELLDDLVRAIFRMGSRPELAVVARDLKGMVPILENLLNTFAVTFGPPLVTMLLELGRTFQFLVEATGPINVMLTLVGDILRVINNLIDTVPGLGRVFSAALSVITIGLFIRKVQALGAAWWGVATGARAAAASEASAVALGGAGVGGGLAAGAAGATAGRWVAGPGGAMVWQAGGAAAGGAALSRMGRLGAGLGRFGSAVGRFALPVTVALGAYGGATAQTSGGPLNQAAQRGIGVANALTFGLFGRLPAPRGSHAGSLAEAFMTPGQRAQRALQGRMDQFGAARAGIGGENPRTLVQLNAQIALYERTITSLSLNRSRIYRDQANQLRSQLSVLERVRHSIERQRAEQSRARGYQFIRQTGQAYDIYAEKLGPVEALRRTNREVLGEMRRLQGPGRMILAQQYLAWAQEEARRNPALRKQYENLADQIRRTFRELGRHVLLVNGRIYEGTRSAWRNIENAMANPAERAQQRVSDAFTAIQQRAVYVLRAMGFSPDAASRLVSAMERGGAQGAAAGAVASGAAGMGALDVAQGGGVRHRATGGRNLGDNTVAVFNPTELVVNRHTERAVNSFLRPFGRTLEGMVNYETRPHSGPMRGFATGGRGGGGGGGLSLAGVQPGIHAIADEVLSKFPLAVTSTTQGRHAKGSYHYRGMAVDLAGSAALMNAAAGWIMSSGLSQQLLEGIHNPNLSVKNGAVVRPGFWGATTWGQHLNHIHLAAGGGGARGSFAGLPGGVGTVSIGQLYPGPGGIPGVPGVMADQAALLMAAAGTRRLNNLLASQTTLPGAGGGGGSTANMQLAHRMMLQRWPETEWPALRSLWMGESGFRSDAVNRSSGATGIPQALPGSKMASIAPDWRTNPATQIAWGLQYIAGRYNSPSAAYGAWLARKPHWYGDGGDFVARKPMMIGVGDRGAERVTITPTHRMRGGGGVTLQVHIAKIENHRPGDIRRIVHDEFEKLASDLDLMAFVGDEEVMR